MKYLALAVALLVAAVALVAFAPDDQTYIPVVRVRSSEGSLVTAVQPATKSRSSCSEAIDRLLPKLMAGCKDCISESACVAEPSGLELALAKGGDVPVHSVVSKSVRLALVGPPDDLQRNCEKLALQVGPSGVASCVTPRKGTDPENLPYHPVVNVSLVKGLSITALLPETHGQDACVRANERFLTPFKDCKECKLQFARCERQLVGLESAMSEGTPIPHPMVVARDVRIAVMGPPESARLGCQFVAADIVAKGVPAAECIQPKKTRAKG